MTGFNLTHPSTPSSPPLHPGLTIPTTGPHPVTIHPPKSALIIIDMQNFFLSPDLGRSADSPGLKAQHQLLTHAIPAARAAGIQVIWLNWGLTEEDLNSMPPVTLRCFGFDTFDANGHTSQPAAKHLETAGKNANFYVGLGNDLGSVQGTSAASGETKTIEVGRMFMRGSWNAALHGPLHNSYIESQDGAKPDVIIHKNRASGFAPSHSSPNPTAQYLESTGITTLLFAGVNTDQCVLSSLTDACFLGYDVILLRDGCGTTSPGDAAAQVDYNVEGGWGFVGDCQGFADGVREMEKT